VAAVPVGELDKALAAVGAEGGELGCYSRPDQATALVRVAIESGAELVRDIAGEGFVTVMVGGHRETWPVRSKALSSSI
jgi:hypothetical protein